MRCSILYWLMQSGVDIYLCDSWNQGQTCCAGSRIFVHAKIYDEFLQKFTAKIKSLKVGDPFDSANYQGAQVSQQQYDVRSIPFLNRSSIDSFAYYLQRIMGYIQSGKSEGATCHIGGERQGTEGYFIQPTIFTDCKPNMKIVREEIFGPVGVLIKFDDDDDVVRQANDTVYGLAAAIFSQDINRAIKTANRVQAGTVWVRLHSALGAYITCLPHLCRSTALLIPISVCLSEASNSLEWVVSLANTL